VALGVLALCVLGPSLAATAAKPTAAQAEIDSITPDDVAQYPLGSVLNCGQFIAPRR
jgi:hypothetical protein